MGPVPFRLLPSNALDRTASRPSGRRRRQRKQRHGKGNSRQEADNSLIASPDYKAWYSITACRENHTFPALPTKGFQSLASKSTLQTTKYSFVRRLYTMVATGGPRPTANCSEPRIRMLVWRIVQGIHPREGRSCIMPPSLIRFPTRGAVHLPYYRSFVQGLRDIEISVVAHVHSGTGRSDTCTVPR